MVSCRNWVFVAGLGIALVAGGARAEERAKKPPTAADAPGVSADVITRLKSGDLAQMKSALDDVRMAGVGGASAVPTIAALLEQGLPLDLTQAAIDTLADTQSPAATPVLTIYARHRELSIRRSAVQALAKTRGPEAAKAMRAALSDPDPGVRGLAATALGGLKAHDFLGDLFRALDRGIPEAAVSIGELCAGEECATLAGKLGKLPLDVVTSGLDQVLFRPAGEVPDELKVKIVERVRDVGTGPANRFLKQVQERMRAGAPPRVKQAVDAAVMATNTSPGARGDQP
jgi:HEAT repeat protein